VEKMSKNKKLTVSIFFMSLIIGCCSTTPNSADDMEANKELSKYLKSFKEDMGSRVKPSDMKRTGIRFGELEGSTMGLCAYIPIWRHSVVTIDEDGWANYTEAQRMNLVYHELGHCVCGLGHSWEFGGYPEADDDGISASSNEKSGYFEDGCPASLMYPYVMGEECSKKHWAEYVKDLYNRCYP
jgi:hypothetical protein